MRLNLYHHHIWPSEVPPWVAELNRKLGLILENQERSMATLDEVLQEVTDESTQLGGIATLISGLQQQVKDATSNTGISPSDQAKIDKIFDQAKANKQQILNALVSGTPADQSSPGSGSTGTDQSSSGNPAGT